MSGSVSVEASEAGSVVVEKAVEAVESQELTLLEAMEEAFPIKQRIDVEGWPRPVWIWRVELAQVLDLNAKRALAKDGNRGLQEWGVELLAISLGDEGAPGSFASARGRSWLRRQPEALTKLIAIAAAFNGLSKPIEESGPAHEANTV